MLERLIVILKDQLGDKIGEIDKDTKLKADLALDSLDMVDIALAVEEEFDIEFEDDALNKFVTVGDVVRYIKSQKE